MDRECLSGTCLQWVRICPLFGARMTSNFELELASSLEFENGFTATTVLHPATYLNKVLVASSEGNMQLWNIRTQ